MYKHLFRFRFLIFLIVLPVGAAKGGNPAFLHFDSQHGLPSVEVYDLHEDADGRMWFATDRGVCSYDGYGFQTYGLEDGLAHAAILQIIPDPEGNLWFLGLDNSMSLLEKDRFVPYPGNEALREVHPGTWVGEVVWDEKGNLVLSSTQKQPRFYCVSNRQTGHLEKLGFQQLEKRYGDKNRRFRNAIWINDQPLAHFSDHKTIVTGPDSTMFFGFRQTNPQDLYISRPNDGKLTRLYRFPHVIHGLNLDPGGDLWVSTQEGVYRFSGTDFFESPEVYFPEFSISRVYVDREGSYWFTSNNSGIIFVPSLDFYPFGTENLDGKTVSSVTPFGDHLFLTTTMGEILILDSLGNLSHRFFNPVFHGTFERGTVDTGGVNIGNFRFVKTGDSFLGKGTNEFSKASMSRQLSNGEYVFGGFFGWRIRTPDRLHKAFRPADTISPRTECAVESGQRLLMGTIEGILVVDSFRYDQPTWLHEQYPVLRCRIKDLLVDGWGNTWIATMGKGLFYLTPDSLFHLSEADGLGSNLVNRLALEGDSALWVAGNMGLSRVKYQWEGGQLHSKIDGLSISDGLPSNHVRDLAFWRGKVWVGTEAGLHHFSASVMDRKHPVPPIALERVLVNDSVWEGKNSPLWVYDQNDIVFEYLAISYRKPSQVPFYRYRLIVEGQEGDWYPTNDRRVHYNNLGPGKYRFEAAAQNLNGEWSHPGVGFDFEILPHFSQTHWFRGLVGLLGFVVMGLVLRGFRNRVRVREGARADRKFQQQATRLLGMAEAKEPETSDGLDNSLAPQGLDPGDAAAPEVEVEDAGELPLRQLVLPGRNGYLVIELDEVVYFEADGNYVMVHLADGRSQLASQSLNHYESLLESEMFFRTHKSFLVNCAKVTRYEGGRGGLAFLSDGRSLPIAFRRKAAFVKQMKNLTPHP